MSATPKTAAPTTPAPSLCRCGCKAPTVRPEARYVAGHDARHAGEVGRSKAPEAEVRKIFADSPRLAEKALGVRATAARREAEKAARKAAHEAAKAAADAVRREHLAAAGF